jgi:hypothetical protein
MGKRLDHARHEHRLLDAEAGIDETEALAEQAKEVARIARRPRRGDADALAQVVDPAEDEVEAACALAPGLEVAAEVAHEVGRDALEDLGRADRLGEGASAGRCVGGKERLYRIGLAAECLVEAADELGAEAADERPLRLLDDLTNALEAGGTSRLDGLARQPQGLKRKL